MNKSTLKTNFFKIIDRLPASVGYDLYHKVQTFLDRGMANKIVPNKKSLEKMETILATQNESLAQKNVLEIGSGWMPLMPYFLKYFGKCGHVFTYDINEHYNNKWLSELNGYFTKHYQIDVELTQQGRYKLPGFVHYFPKQNVIDAQLPQNVDLIFSRFVLEHVTPSDLQRMHETFYKTYSDQTLILHFISPSDHRAYSDSSISHYDFLKYSQAEWDNIQTKFDYHNRLRLPQFLEIFDKTGFEVVYLEYDKVDPDSKKYELFKKLNIHADFNQFSEDEILAGSINVLLRKKSV